MQKVNIQMTERHLAYCYDLVKNQPVDTFLSTATSIKNAVKANTDPAALLTVEIEVPIIETIYRKASQLPEGYATNINNEIKEVLIPQLMQYAQAEGTAQAEAQATAAAANEGKPEEEWVSPEYVDMSVTNILTAIQAFTQATFAQLDNTIAAALQKLKA